MICGNEECGKTFESNTHNQKYCSPECCRTATNKRIKAEYHANRARLRGEQRQCACGNFLSRYNPGKICQQCEAKKITRTRIAVLEHFGVYHEEITA